MNPPLATIASSGATGLHTRRCARHATREAAARCPACGEFFCRECVVEHHGKLLCAACLAKRTAVVEHRRQRWLGVRRAVRLAAGAVALWLVFYWIGALLLKVPPEMHDGTVWKKLAEGPGP